jgi:hypothetical protein
LAAFSQFSEPLNWKIMENGKWKTNKTRKTPDWADLED